MAAPTWDGWQAVFDAQNADVESHSECLYPAQWQVMDILDWVPQMSGTGITWDFCAPEVNASAFFAVGNRMHAKHHDLWTPVGEEDTEWFRVNYPK